LAAAYDQELIVEIDQSRPGDVRTFNNEDSVVRRIDLEAAANAIDEA